MLEGYVTTGLSHNAQSLGPWTHHIHSLSWKQLEKWQRCIQDVFLLICRIYVDVYINAYIHLSIYLSITLSLSIVSCSLYILSCSLHSPSLSLSIVNVVREMQSDAINPLAPAR